MRNDKTVCGNCVVAVFVAGVASLVWASSAQAVLTTYWDFNESSGAVLPDVIGSSDGTLLEGFAPGFGPTWVAGRTGAGNALNFNPDNGDAGHIIDSVSVADDTALEFGDGAMTFTGWFRATDLPVSGLNQNATFFDNSVHGFGGITAGLFRINTPVPSGATGRLVIDVKGTGVDGNVFVRSNTNLDDSVWHWYAMVAQGGPGGLLNLYVDGVIQTINATYGAGTTASPVQATTSIGSRNPNSNHFIGDLDDIAFFDTALSGTLDQVGNLTGGDLFTLWQNGPLAVGADLEGDLDGDGFVGLSDLDIILGDWNQNVPPGDIRADVSGAGAVPDGFIGLDDLDVVLGNWNAGTPPADSAAIPEPATLSLLGFGAMAMVRRRY